MPRRARPRVIVRAVVAIVVVATLVASISSLVDQSSGVQQLRAYPASSGAPANTGAIARAIAPELVTITARTASGYAYATGMVLAANGLILTNNHVIDGETQLEVTDVGNGRSYSAGVIGYDTAEDVAVIAATGATGLASITAGVNDPLVHGMGVVAVGNAQGLGFLHYAGGHLLTQGDVAVVGPLPHFGFERLTDVLTAIVTCAPGDSGGALADAAGRVIGMITAVSESSAAYAAATPADYQFSISMRTAMSIVNEILSGESSSVIHLGASPTPPT